MSLLVIGLSYRTAPIGLLEALAAAPADVLAQRVASSGAVEESVVLSTCNRLEVYAEAVTFHGAVATIGEVLADLSGVGLSELTSHLYVHYEDRAVAHAFTVACGLDSMAIGEVQVLGQLREALRTAQESSTAGPSLNSLLQQALRVGKRAHSETGIDTVSKSLVESGLDHAEALLGPLASSSVLVVGAGGMSGLVAATAARRGAQRLVIANRTLAKAERLAQATGGTAVPMSELGDALAGADVVLSSTGSVGNVLGVADITAAARSREGRPLVLVDLALPHDVDRAVADLPGVELVGLAELGAELAALADVDSLPQAQKVRDLVTGEVAAYLTGRAVASVAPTVAALRSRAAGVVDAELERLDQRMPALDPATRAEVTRTIHRVVEKLLHTPTARVKELSSDGHGQEYAAALRELFDLDPHVVATVSTPPAPSPLRGNLGGES
ncbi:glutamyl-tRNA reductase [Lapillicoccus sp.]|uniref:glutamyl-tRNA reductase n=1 Tax=Lapillicoccus sp. TaxID=1909287 RepID=UPI003267E761